MNMQQKFLDRFSEIVTSRGLEPVVQAAWANTGKVFVQSGFETFFVLDYGFNTDYATLRLYGPAIDGIEGLDDNPPSWRLDTGRTRMEVKGNVQVVWHALGYGRSDRVATFFELVTKAADAAKELIPTDHSGGRTVR